VKRGESGRLRCRRHLDELRSGERRSPQRFATANNSWRSASAGPLTTVLLARSSYQEAIPQPGGPANLHHSTLVRTASVIDSLSVSNEQSNCRRAHLRDVAFALTSGPVYVSHVNCLKAAVSSACHSRADTPDARSPRLASRQSGFAVSGNGPRHHAQQTFVHTRRISR
jgi:hypothetical protein